MLSTGVANITPFAPVSCNASLAGRTKAEPVHRVLFQSSSRLPWTSTRTTVVPRASWGYAGVVDLDKNVADLRETIEQLDQQTLWVTGRLPRNPEDLDSESLRDLQSEVAYLVRAWGRKDTQLQAMLLLASDLRRESTQELVGLSTRVERAAQKMEALQRQLDGSRSRNGDYGRPINGDAMPSYYSRPSSYSSAPTNGWTNGYSAPAAPATPPPPPPPAASPPYVPMDSPPMNSPSLPWESSASVPPTREAQVPWWQQAQQTLASLTPTIDLPPATQTPLQLVPPSSAPATPFEVAVTLAAAIALPTVIASEYNINATGCCGLPPGPFGLLGTLEAVSYLTVLSIISWSVYRRVVNKEKGLPPGPYGALAAVEGLSYAVIISGLFVLTFQGVVNGWTPGIIAKQSSCITGF